MIAAFRITVVFLVLAQATAAWGDDAAAALVETCKALRSNEPVRMTSTLTLESTRSGPPVPLDPITAVIDRTGPGTGVFRIGEYDAYISDGEVIVIRDGVDDAYVRCHRESIPAASIHRAMASCPFPLLAMSFPAEDPKQTAARLHSELDTLEPRSFERDDQGRLTALTCSSPSGDLVFQIDPETGRPGSAVLKHRDPEGMPAGSSVTYRWNWTYQAPPEDEAMTFTRGRRFRLDRVSALKRSGETTATTGGEAPALRLPALDGGMIDLARLRGRVVVVDFWATWCGPCRRALPQLQTLADEMAEEPVTVLTVDCFERTSGAALRDAVSKMVKDLDLRLPVLLDEQGDVARAGGVRGIPATFVIDPQGRISASHTGAGPDYLQQLREDVVSALQPAP